MIGAEGGEMGSRITAGLLVVWGVGLLVATVAFALVPRAAAGRRVLDTFRSDLAPGGLRQIRGDYDVLAAAADDLSATVLPQLAVDVARYPKLETGLARLPQLRSVTDRIIANLEHHAGDASLAYGFPLGRLPLSLLAWATPVIGVALVALAERVLRAPGRGALIAAVAVASAFVIVPLALSLPRQLAHADALFTSLTPVDPAKIALRRELIGVGRDMVDDVEHRVLPDAAAAAGRPSEPFAREIASAHPALGQGLAQADAALDRFDALVSKSETRLADLRRIEGLPIALLPWLFIVPGTAVAASAITSVARKPRP